MTGSIILQLTQLKSLIKTPELKYFVQKPYGLEMVLFLYEAQKYGREVSIDEVYNSLVSPMPRREAFGLFLNQLQNAYLIKKKKHSSKNSMKKIELSSQVFNALDAMN